uniref:Uncharacterized protein n=1 Tax=Panagrolaimus sp. PS1159 TaxID=55785 RepID=A0AC35GS58_9BILA
MRGSTKKSSAQVKKKHPKSAIYEEASKYPVKIKASDLPSIYHLTETCSSSKPHPNKY